MSADPGIIDEGSLIVEEVVGGGPPAPGAAAGLPEDFDEQSYLAFNPDVADGVADGSVLSGAAHYLTRGYLERRRYRRQPDPAANGGFAVSFADEIAPVSATPARGACDAVLMSRTGGVAVIGWIDDLHAPLDRIEVAAGGWRLALYDSALSRLRRADVEQALEKNVAHAFGVLGYLHTGEALTVPEKCRVTLTLRGGRRVEVVVAVQEMSAVALRRAVLGQIAHAAHFGDPAVAQMVLLERGMGDQLLKLNADVTAELVASPWVERFGQRRRAPRGSIVVCLYGKPEFQFLQNCLFHGLPGIDEYEFVYVSNSPELADAMLREARIAAGTYQTRQTVVILPGNAGFGAANNVGAREARSDRLLIVNPDVFPHAPDWAARHTALLEAAPAEQTRLFGVPLYYDDASLMHGGMYFALDRGLLRVGGRMTDRAMVRVEHYGKGAPPGAEQFRRSRPVPAVTGAFMSIDRSWFEQLGGFTEDFVFGHYEDADLCLKSLSAGTPAWLHDLPMWHLEGKGSTREAEHEGGSAVNRWHFSRLWSEEIESELNGPAPRHAAFAAGMAEVER